VWVSSIGTHIRMSMRPVPGMLTYEIGIDIGVDGGPWDIAIYSEFKDRAALEAYQQHPKHLAIKPVIAPLRESRAAVDYEI